MRVNAAFSATDTVAASAELGGKGLSPAHVVDAFKLKTLTASLCPTDGNSANLTAYLCFHHMRERFDDDPPLESGVERNAEMVPHPERDEHRARHLQALGHITSNGDGDGRNLPSFYGALDQRDRLVSYRSSRRKEHDIGPLLGDRVGEIFGKGALEPVRIHVVPNE